MDYSMLEHRVGRVGIRGNVNGTRRWPWLGMGMQNGAKHQENVGEKTLLD